MGAALSGCSPSVKVLWSSHTWVEPYTTALSYSEFQLPWSPSVGSHCGKQSTGLSKVRLRTMTLSTSLIWRLAPLSAAPRPTPMMVVSAGTFALMDRSCCAAEARRSPSGLSSGSALRSVSLPQFSGEYFSR
ncbi:hypothetical protein STENM223S_08317 [Streptomyces tendae]